MEKNKKVALGIGLVAATGLAGSALAANISIDGTPNAGQGTSVIGGFNATNVSYTTDVDAESTALEGNVTAVSFNLYKGTDTSVNAGTGTTVWVQLREGTTGKNWASCTAGTLPAWSCSLTGGQQSQLADVTELSIIAYE